VVSTDLGASWSAPKTIFTHEAAGEVPKVCGSRLLVAKDGTWYLPGVWPTEQGADRVSGAQGYLFCMGAHAANSSCSSKPAQYGSLLGLPHYSTSAPLLYFCPTTSVLGLLRVCFFRLCAAAVHLEPAESWHTFSTTFHPLSEAPEQQLKPPPGAEPQVRAATCSRGAGEVAALHLLQG